MAQDPGVSIRLLYVADPSRDENEYRRALDRQTDFSVVGVAGIDAAFDHLETGVDCVVCDHGGAIDGIGFLERVRERHPDLPFVLLAPEDGMLASRAVSAGVSGYVPRTDEAGTPVLVERIRSLADAPRVRADGTYRMPIEELGMAEELRLKERAMDEAPVGITISDAQRPDNPLIYVNDAFVELTGYEKDETVGRNCRFLQGEESDPDAIAAMREAIDREEPVSVELVNYGKDGEAFWNKIDIAPIRDEAGGPTNYVGFQTDVSARKDAEFEVKRERGRLDHVLDRINGLLEDIHGDLVRAISRESVERSVCQRIATTDAYAFCWIARPNLSRDTLEATSWAGEWEPVDGQLDIHFPSDSSDASPILEAYETERIQIVDESDELARIAADAPWIEGTSLQGVAAIPLVYQNTCYGVVTVHAAERDALNEREAVVLESLGRATATTINSLERERIIVADQVVELEFEIRDPDLFFVDLSANHGVDVEYNGSIYRQDGSMQMFFTADIEPSLVEERLEEHPDVGDVSLINEADGGNLFEVTVGEESIITNLAARGARTRSMNAIDGVGRLSVELPTETDARAIVERLQTQYSDTDLVVFRERERPPETKQEFIGELTDNLTQRQLTALQTAYVSGFYEWKRPVSGDELAESMDIGRSTFHQHLRAAERKLIEQIFEGGGSVVATS